MNNAYIENIIDANSADEVETFLMTCHEEEGHFSNRDCDDNFQEILNTMIEQNDLTLGYFYKLMVKFKKKEWTPQGYTKSILDALCLK